MHFQLRFAVERNQHRNGDHTASVMVETGTRPGFPPRVARNKVLKLFIERRQLLQRSVYVCIAQYLPTYRHALLIAWVIAHYFSPEMPLAPR